ncbi:MAG: U32 family peptidase [Bacteroidales bacterium]|nr:U32 family peptidase [Candidatus Cacconaster scatequi]
MQLSLELLAPARDLEIGIAAIQCGADAVYIAGPRFGARVAAGNTIEDVASLCTYAHRFGVRIYATLNTLLTEEELPEAEDLIWQYYRAGVDALIVQDYRIIEMNLPPIELHASTQTSIRTVEKAVALEKAGFSRIVLERQMSMERVKEICEAVSCEVEFFVHGALCMSYSGECYLSEHLAGRSANRGCCAQPCRSLYDVYDAEGGIVARQKHILSMKDYRLDSHIPELAEAGVCSFKIEGRLKNASYVKNTVRHYSNILNEFIHRNPEYRRASFGQVEGGFTPDPEITFNRGYTTCFIDGKRGVWNSQDAAKAMGKCIGTVRRVDSGKNLVEVETAVRIANGDGLMFAGNAGDPVGMRVEVARGDSFTVRDASALRPGMKIYRNLDLCFERELEKNVPRRIIEASVDYHSRKGHTRFTASFCDGSVATVEFNETAPEALNSERARAMLEGQIGKISGDIRFSLINVDTDRVYSYTSAFLNSVRRELAEKYAPSPRKSVPFVKGDTSGLERQGESGGILMKSKYCVRYELGLCSRKGKGGGPLYLENNGNRLKLEFDCKNCEMSLSL